MEAVKLHTVFITYNRLELTKRAIETYLETVSCDFSIWISDNGSEDGTEDWVRERWLNEWFGQHWFNAHFFRENLYPGRACNLGWEHAPSDATHLHRADNDFIFLPGWCEEVERMFSENPKLGQLGLRTDEEELFNANNVGGNCVVHRRLWDKGLRWDETPWPDIPQPGYTEDSYFSPNVKARGWQWDRVERPCIQSISFEDPADPYYQQTWADRGIAR